MSVDEKAIRHYQKREKSCRGCKSNYPISSAMIAPVLPGPRRYSEVFTRGSILYCVARTFNIPSLSRNLLTKDTEDYVTGLEDWAGVAISCTTCAIRGKQRSRIGDLGKRPENRPLPLVRPPPPNYPSSFHRLLLTSTNLLPRLGNRNTRLRGKSKY